MIDESDDIFKLCKKAISHDRSSAISVSAKEKIVSILKKIEPDLSIYCVKTLGMLNFRFFLNESEKTSHENTLKWVEACICTINFIVNFTKFCKVCEDLKDMNPEEPKTSATIFGVLIFIKKKYGLDAFTRCDTKLRNEQNFSIWPMPYHELFRTVGWGVDEIAENKQKIFAKTIIWIREYIEDKDGSS